MPANYFCSACGTTYSIEEYSKSHFCLKCGKLLSLNVITTLRETDVKNTPMEIRKEDVNVESIFREYMTLRPFPIGQMEIFPSASLWIVERKNAYMKYQEKFRSEKLHELNQVAKDYINWLKFSQNRSWTNLPRGGKIASKGS